MRAAAALLLAFSSLGHAHDPSLQAIVQYNTVLERRPDDLEALRGRGSTFRALELFDDALTDLERADAIAPGWAETVAEIGICRYMLGETERAMEILLRADKLLAEQSASGQLPPEKAAPIEREFRETLVRLYRDRGDFKAALAQCDILEKYVQGKLAFKCDKADLLLDLGEVDAALLLYEEAVEWNGVYERHCVGAANCYIVAGFVNKALEVMENWSREEPDNPLPRMFRSIVLRDHAGDAAAAADEADAAVRLARAALADDFPDVEPTINLARALQAAGDYEGSAAQIGPILEYARGHYLVTAIQAANYRGLGRNEEAVSFEREAALYKRLNPDDWLQGYEIIRPGWSPPGPAAAEAGAGSAAGPGGETSGAGGRLGLTAVLGLAAACAAGAAVVFWIRRRRSAEG